MRHRPGRGPVRRALRLPPRTRAALRMARRLTHRRRLAGLPPHRVRRKRTRIEAETGRLLPPALPQRLLVDVALVRARHQRRPRREMRIAPRIAEAAPAHRRLDLRAPRRERVDRRARYAGNLEASVGMRLLDAIAQPFQTARELRTVESPDQHLRRIELLVGHGAPLAVLALHHVGDHRMRVELRIEIARGGRGGTWRSPPSGLRCAPCGRFPHPSFWSRRRCPRSRRGPCARRHRGPPRCARRPRSGPRGRPTSVRRR